YKALEKREKTGDPVKVAMIGAGFMGKGIALQFQTAVKGMRLVAIANRTLEKAVTAYHEAGLKEVDRVERQEELDRAIKKGRSCVTTNPQLLCTSAEIDVIIEATGAIQYSDEIVLAAINNKKHVVLMNAELDATVGPILKVYADRNGVVITNADGDQPGVIMNLYRFLKGIGV